MDFDISKVIAEAQKSVDIDQRWTTLGEGGEDDMPEAVLTIGGAGQVMLAKDVTDWLATRAPRPRERAGTAVFTELDSFIAHVRRNRGEQSAIFANTKAFELVAVYDYHEQGPPTASGHKPPESIAPLPPTASPQDIEDAKADLAAAWAAYVAAGRAGWMRHRAKYSCPRSRQWETWTARDGAPMSQADFGDFLESNLEDVTTEEGMAAPAQLVDMARNLQVYTSGVFERKIDPTTGTGTLVCKEEHGANSTRIPRAFALAIPVFDAGERYLIEARIRFAMEGGRPRFAYVLHNRARVEQDAFGVARRKVERDTELPVFAGTPE